MQVPPEIALECMAYFTEIMQGSDIDKIKAAYSATVSHDTPDYAGWLNANGYLSNTANFKIAFGIYTANAAKQLNIPQYEGRLTVFIWPIQKGAGPTIAMKEGVAEESSEAAIADPGTWAPYNMGGLTP